jgi:hypothetical protein
MGRPLKIKKSTTKDIGFNNLGSLTDPTYPATMTAANFFGVVGGANAQGGSSIATSSYPVVKAVAFVPGDSEYRNAYIITQKGTTKYLVAAINSIADEDIVAGRTYIINTVGTTNWTLFGASANAAPGDVFTALGNGTNSGTGTVFLVGTCALANDTTPASGFMSITMNVNGDSTEISISRLTNHYALDYSTPKVRYAVNFFTDEASVIKSGTSGGANTASQQNTLQLGQVDQYTS